MDPPTRAEKSDVRCVRPSHMAKVARRPQGQAKSSRVGKDLFNSHAWQSLLVSPSPSRQRAPVTWLSPLRQCGAAPPGLLWAVAISFHLRKISDAAKRQDYTRFGEV